MEKQALLYIPCILKVAIFSQGWSEGKGKDRDMLYQ